MRQGDPLFPYLFLLVLEIIAIAVRENSSIKGITTKDEETKLFQYADGTTVLCGKDSAHILFKLLDKFGTFSGLPGAHPGACNFHTASVKRRFHK